jgi:hypothetical protein
MIDEHPQRYPVKDGKLKQRVSTKSQPRIAGDKDISWRSE